MVEVVVPYCRVLHLRRQ